MNQLKYIEGDKLICDKCKNNNVCKYLNEMEDSIGLLQHIIKDINSNCPITIKINCDKFEDSNILRTSPYPIVSVRI